MLLICLGGCHGVPAPIAAELARGPANKVTIIELTDFQCPYCRLLHEILAEIVAPHRGSIHLIRKHVPLQMHPLARDAARAAICAELAGKGDDMADALAQAGPEHLGPPGSELIAVSLGLDREAFRRCLADPQTEAQINADLDLYQQLGRGGVPQLWIGERGFLGLQTESILRQALERELARRR